MSSYKDKTFCPMGILCKKYQHRGCDRVLTDEDVRIIEKENVPVAFYGETPECFVAFFEELKDDIDGES